MDTAVVSGLADGSRAPVRRRVALVFTDIVGSTRLLSALGDMEGSRRIHEHHRLAARTLRRVGGGEIINTGGDSIFLAFEHLRDALRFALRLQRELRAWLVDEPVHLRVRDRVGVHLGEVEESRRPDGAKDLTGFAVSLAFSVMELAGPDQILLSSAAFDFARATADESDLAEFSPLRWLSHGRYHIKGLESPVAIFEVGEAGMALLQAPRRDPDDRLTADDDFTGWRPAIGNPVPGTQWTIERFLGASGFGEVWLARDAARRERRALRFCFHAAQVRALREATPLFERLCSEGDKLFGMARLHGFQFDHAPHYLENEYVAGSSLAELCHPSAGNPPLDEAQRLEIIAQVAETLHAAHRVGIVHGDLKPAAVIVRRPPEPDARPQVRLIDFGTGLLVARELAAELAQGIVPNENRPDLVPPAGAPLYWAPELFKGSQPTPASDIYALGVLLYQVIVCDVTQPVTVDVARRVRDPLLLDDVLACLATDPQARPAAAGELAARLRRLPERRRELAQRERRGYWQGVLRTAAVAAVVIGITGGLAWREMEKEREATQAARAASHAQHIAEANAVSLRVANGVRMMTEGDLTGALEQFVEALRQDTGGLGKEDIHRRRIGSVLRSAPRKVSEWRLSDFGGLLAIDPGGRWIAAATADGEVQGWNVDEATAAGVPLKLGGPIESLGFTHEGELYSHVTDGPVRVWPWPWDGEQEGRTIVPAATDLACTPDGSRLVFAADDSLVLASASPGESILLGRSKGVYHLAISPGGNLLAAAGRTDAGETIAIWNLATRQRVQEGNPVDEPVRFLEFDAGGDLLLVGTLRDVHLIRVSDLRPAAPPRRHADVVMWAGFARRGTLMMSTSAGPGSRVQVSDTLGPAGLPIDLPHPHSVTSGDLSPDGRYVLTACFDRYLRLWNPSRGRLVSEPVRHPAWQNHLNFQMHFLPDGRRAATLVDDAVRVFDFAGHASSLPPLELEEPIKHLTLSKDGRYAACATGTGMAAVWNVLTGARTTPRIHHPRPVSQIIFSPDTRRLVAIEEWNGRPKAPSRIWMTDLSQSNATPLVVGEMTQPIFGFVVGATDLHVISSAGEWFIWRMDRQGAPPIERRLNLRIREGEVSPEHARLATITETPEGHSEIRIWDTASGAQIGPVVKPGYHVRDVAFNGGGTQFVTACTDALLEPRPGILWESASGRRLEPSLWHEDGVMTAAWHPRGTRLVTGGEDSLVRLWNPGLAEPLRAEQRMGYQVLHVGFSGDGQLVAATSVDGTAQVWESETGEPVTPVLRHPALVWRSWFTTDAQSLLTLCDDGAAYIWDLRPVSGTADELAVLARVLKGDARPGAVQRKDPRPLKTDRWTEVLTVSPVAIAGWHRREAGLCAREGLYDLALEHLRVAIDALQDHWPLRWQQAELLRKSGNIPEAIEAYREVLRLDPDCVAAQERIDQLTAGSEHE